MISEVASQSLRRSAPSRRARRKRRSRSAKGPMENSEQQAHAQLESIVAMIAALRMAIDDEQRDTAETRIQEDPLSVEVRADWHAVGAEQSRATEFRIELCTGGPAVRIIGDLNQYCEPENPRIECQDWFTPWRTLASVTDEQNNALLEYCRVFCFVI